MLSSVRSFDNTRSETIQFYTPLTLIVGYNGSGKTTIIECLKYATTGDQPPNSRGGAFIHDPKLCGEKEVLAQVKLSFKATNGAKMVATRSLQLTVKKNSRTVKSLEGQLMALKDGERIAISSRVAELDQIMPQYLGVSKAILDSVIFCHQDESLWPMAEPSALKKRFDEIFEAMKYTKAIDNIKVLRKNQNEELGKLRIIEQHSKDDKDKGERAEKRSQELFEEIEELRTKSESLGDKIGEAKEKYDAAWERISFLSGIVGELSGKRIEHRAKQENVQRLKRNLKEMADSDEDLQEMLEQYQTRVGELQAWSEAEKRRYSDMMRVLSQSRETLSVKERECGSFEAQKANHERQLEQREQLVKQTARKHNIRGYELDVDEDKVLDFIEKISRMAQDQHTAFERARRETQQQLQSAQAVLNRISEQKSALNQKKESARASIAANDRRIGGFQAELDNIEIDEGGKVILESSIADTETKLRLAKEDLRSKNLDRLVEENDAKLRSLDEQKEKLDSDLVQATRQAGESARLDFLRKEVRDREHSLQTMVGAHGSKISEIVTSDWQPSTLDADYQGCLEQSRRHLAEAERARDGTTRELDQLAFRLKTCSSELKTKKSQLSTAETSLRKLLGADPSEYPSELQKAIAERDQVLTDAKYAESVLGFWKNSLQVAQEKKCCRMCTRRYDSKDTRQYEVFVGMLRNEIAKAEKGSDPEELRNVEEDFQAVQEFQPTYDTWLRLKEVEIPPLASDEAHLKSKHDALTRQAEEGDREVEERLNAKRDIESLSKTVQNIVKYSNEMTLLQKQIEELSEKQKHAGLSRGLEAIQDDLKKVNEDARATKVALTKIIGERDGARGIINTLELELRDNRGKLSTAVYQLKEKLSLEKQVDELKAQNSEHRDVLRSTDEEIRGLGPDFEQAKAKYDDTARRGQDRDRQLQAEKSALDNSVNELKVANRDIEDYLSRNGPAQLDRAKSEVELIKQEITRVEGEMNEITKQVKKFETDLRDVEETKRQIADNQDYRRDRNAARQIAAEISELESHNAEEEKSTYEREGNRWEMERNKLVADQASIMGQLKSKDDILQQLIQDWETEYKGAAEKYKEAHIKVETTKAAVEDLTRYGSALDKAIMKYHALKMEEINRIIEELWRKTYQGTDVDTIGIRSDNENMKGNKNYNYRVVMVKQDAEMDMRGRCSAGQKVLASIIIRLALAECFGVNCGLIALDEPTTNLDRDNIRALAASLAEIIRVRRQQRNFQLIVITHDEEFLRYMQCADFCDYYYRISRNERQKSMIIRQSIAEVL
ncbi:hypothetical protein AAFC00_002695 [Neodothiora populina]|uniref:Rad50/SbcC-type AAA domain-containing protein n=1 Tax=Neodothiora populina TaxID=2781224 RepID=A0ABR3P980_9PEZI